ncbi:MAG TPA: hypothetical protein VLA54_08985 [Acidimicrobiia bacterium]|nr:hypothetical protein [Acidimicrobiia bacterium]
MSAWVVNQVVRIRPLDVQRLIRAGEAIEQAQGAALTGRGGAEGLEEARREEESALRLLRAAAAEVAPSASAVTFDRVQNTLRAAARTPEGRSLLSQGRLVEDLEPPGFEALSGLATSKPAGKRAIRSPSRHDGQLQGKLQALRKRKRDADESAEGKANEARELERQAQEAAEAAQRASRAAASARRRAEAAAEQAQRLGAELAELERRAPAPGSH